MRPRPAPLLVRRYAHASIRDMVTACAPAGLCPGCHGTGLRPDAAGLSIICECVEYSAYMALSWGPALPEYPPPQYDTCEEVEDA